MSTTRFALLFGDDIIVDALAIAAAFGDYAHTFCQLLAYSLGPNITDVPFALDAYDVVYDITFPLNDVRYDGLASAEDPTPWVIELLDHVKHILARQPSLKPHGLCFGRQVTANQIEQGDREVSATKPTSAVVYDQGVAILERLLGDLESGYYETTAPTLYMWISHSAEKRGPVWSRMPCPRTE